MKKLNKIFLLLAFSLGVFTSHAQDENNPLAITIGTNAVDFYSADNGGILGETESGSLFSQYFNVKDHWNFIPSVSFLEVRRYVGDGFSARLSGSINQIDQLGATQADDLTFFNLGAGVQYNFKNLLNTSIIDPFLGVGAGHYWLDDNGASTFDSDLGINFWFNDNIALTVKSSFKTAFEDNNLDYFQHSAGITIAFGGSDSDGDGVYDKDDMCPDVPGLAEFNGCPDSDGDGIADKDDKCPDTAGLEEFDGCPDSDSDGVADPNDDCPNDAGSKALNGCPDADNDGVADKNDECPNEVGPKANNGCPYPDTDGDGVLDKDDMCPDVAGNNANNGCPEMTEEAQTELNDFAKVINFASGKSYISDYSKDILDTNVIPKLNEYPLAKFVVEGHTDSTGSKALNQRLSEERAASVKDYLISNGVAKDRLTSVGYGQDKPIAPNNTNDGRFKNRRVEINLKK
jgi:outer membrane protein OmpA-like peptidoglycan-associated protein